MATGKHSGRRRFITREHTSDTSEADTFVTKTPSEERDGTKLKAAAHRIGDTPSAFVRVEPSTKSASSDQSYSNLKNGLIVNTSRSHPQSLLVPKCSEHNPHLTSKWNADHLRPGINTPVDSSSGFVPDSPSFGFRPIRRDSVGSESSSLAGSTVDSELTITNAPQDKSRSQVNVVKPPCHPSVRDHKADPSSRHRPSSYYDSSMLVPRSVLSSTGSASSYDNLDKTDSLLPAHGRDSRTGSDIGPTRAPHSPAKIRPYRSEKNPQCTPSPLLRGGTSRTHGSPFRSDEDRQGFGPKLQMHGAPKESRTGGEKSEIPRFLEGVCRRRTAGGHAQVIPPHLVGVFDPSRVIPASSHVPHDATDRPHLTAAESVPTAGKTSEYAQPYNSRETFGVKSGQFVPVNLPSSSSSSKLSFAYPASNRKPVKVKGGKTRPLQSDSIELSSSESENAFSFRNVNCGGDPIDSTRSKVSRAKFSARASNSIGSDGRNKAAPQNNDLSSVNDLFHYTVAKSGAGPPLGHTEKPEKCDVQTVKAKATAPSKASHSSTFMQDNLKCSSPLTSKYAPKWNSSPLSVGNPASSPKGSPKWEPPKLIKGGLKQNQISSPKGSPKLQKQKSSPANSPKWQYSPLVRSGQSYEPTASPKSSPKYERISTAKSSPKVERVSSAKATSLKYENAYSPKSSPKVERSTLAGRNPRLETLSSNSSIKTGLQPHSQNNFKWESPKAPSLETAVSRMNDPGSHNSNVKTDGDNAEASKVANVTRFSQLHSSSAGNQVTGCGTKLRSNKDKQKQTIGTSQLPSSGATDDILSVQRKLRSPCFRDTSVGEEVAENASKSTEKQSLTEVTTNQKDNQQETGAAAHIKTDVGSGIFSAENSESPQKITFEVGLSAEKLVTMNDEIKTVASEHDVASSVDVQNEKKISQDSGSVEYATGRTAGAATLKLENNSEAQGDRCDSLKTEHDFSHIKDRLDVVSDDGPAGKLVHHSENGESGETEGSKTKSPLPQTKMFTEIQESIEVVTQPCGSRVGSASLSGVLVDASCVTPVDLVGTQPIQGNEPNVPNEYSTVPLQSPLEHSKLTVECSTRSSENVNSSSQGKDTSHVAGVVPNTMPFVADAINNNSKSKMEVSDANEQTSSVSSASEEHGNQEVVVEEHSSTGKSEGKTNVVSSDAELAFPKAVFTVDKEVTFVSQSVASPEPKSSALTTKTESRSNSTQDAEKSEKPQLVVPVSSQASPPTDVFVTLTLHPLDETSSTFQKHCNTASISSPDKTTSDKSFVIPTCQPFSPPPNIVYSCQLVTADAVPIPVTVGKEGLAANETNLSRENVEDKFFSAKSCSESNEQVGKDIKGRTENMGNVRSSTSITNELPDRKRDRLTTELKLKIEDRNCRDTTTSNARDASACSPDISPVMAALDDALAILTSSVMDTNPPSAEICNRIDIPVERFKQDLVKQPNIEKAEKVTFKLHPEVNKAAGRSHTSASSLSKKKTKALHKEYTSPAIVSPDAVDTTMDIVRQEIQTVESRRHQLVKEDSFNRPDSPMFHETLPLPKDSIIRRNREKCCESTSSSDNNVSPLTSPRLVPRSLRKCKRGHNADKSASLPVSSEVPSYKTFAGSHSSSRLLSRHKSDVFLNAQSGAAPTCNKSRRHHNTDAAEVTHDRRPKAVEDGGTDLATTARDGKRRSTDQLPLRSDIQDLQQSLLLYNQRQRGQSWLQMVDDDVRGSLEWNGLPGDKPS